MYNFKINICILNIIFLILFYLNFKKNFNIQIIHNLIWKLS